MHRKAIWKSLLAVLLSQVLIGCTEKDWYYQQPKVLDAGGPLARIPAQETFTFLVIGDTRTGVDVFKRHIEEINLLDPDFVIDVGDMIGGYTDDVGRIEAMWNEFDAIVHRFKVPLVMVVGNHDIWDPVSAEIYRRRYGETYFSFNHKGVHFVVLDSETLGENGSPTNRIAGEQLRWLADDLAKHKGARATLVFLHKPFWQDYHVGADSGKNWMKNVHPILAEHGVSGVFAGHVHKYLKFPTIDGVRYYITGGGGAGIGSDESAGDFHHYCLVTVRGRRWQVAVIRPGAVKPDTLVGSDVLIAP